jgi:adenosylcobyric acid synthase
VEGLGHLEVETVLTGEKSLVSVTGRTSDDAPFSGYEMHMGRTEGPDCARPFSVLSDGRPDGAVSASGRVAGTYVHGLLADDAQRSAWLKRLGGPASDLQYEAGVEAALDGLAAHVETHLDVDGIIAHAR